MDLQNNTEAQKIRNVLWDALCAVSKAFQSSTYCAATTSETNRSLRVFALLIAIDEYEFNDPLHFPNLRGCVADATAMEEYLLHQVSVPPGRIQKLYNQGATRQAIVKHIENLATNDNIQKDDPILIFYAGHGGLANPPASWRWRAGEMIQMILPHNFVLESKKDERSAKDEQDAQGIFDFKIRAMLNKLSEAKGNNITVILDSCHSGSGTRKGSAGALSRGVQLPSDYKVLDTGDADHSRGAIHLNGDTGAGSHILLAACRPSQVAEEKNCRGVFSTALINVLNTPISDMLTYEKIIKLASAEIQLRGDIDDKHRQQPQCEGANSSRILFGGLTKAVQSASYHVQRQEESSILHAGEAHGIARNARFNLFKAESLNGPPCGIAVVTRTGVFTSELQLVVAPEPNPDANPDDSLVAIQTYLGDRQDIKVWIPVDVARDQLFDLFKHHAAVLEARPDYQRRICFVERAEDADLSLRVEADQNNKPPVAFELNHPYCNKFGLTRLLETIPTDTKGVYSVLAQGADFYWHLNRRSSEPDLARFVTVECTKLEKLQGADDRIPCGQNLVKGSEMIIDFDDYKRSAFYGLKFISTYESPIYAAGFYFNMSDLSIYRLYLPVSGPEDAVEPCIPVKNSEGPGTLTIGYEASLWDALQFELPERKNRQRTDIDVGYVKIFLSTKPVDYSRISQDSPFGIKGARGLVKNREKPEVPETWDTIEFAIVLRKRPQPGQVLIPDSSPGLDRTAAECVTGPDGGNAGDGASPPSCCIC